MATKQAVHTFSKGMVKDLDKSLVSKDRYLDAHNFRQLTSTGESTGALENIEGNNCMLTTIAPGTVTNGHKYVVVKGTATYNSVAYTVGQTFTAGASPTTFSGTGSLIVDANQLMEDGMYVAGSAYIRDTVVLFLTNNSDHSTIIKFSIDLDTETLTGVTTLYDDNLNNSTGILDFRTAYPIRTVGVYETPNIQKIYWCDGYNHMRYINIAAYSTTDGLVYTGSNYYFAPDLLEFIPEVTLTRPTLDYLVPGNIKAGVVQYAFQYYTNHGAETIMSPLSDTIHITIPGDYLSTTLAYKGTADATGTTGKGVRLLLTIPDSDRFSHIRIVRLYYETINSVPTITVVGEVDINSNMSTVYFTDGGTETFGTLTLDEFNVGETQLFSAEDIAVKNGRLFAANIINDEFDIEDWDARAVRFKNFGGTVEADVFDSEDSLVYPKNITQPTSDTPAEWNAHGWTQYVATHDGVNKYNDPAYDGSPTNAYAYQSDGTTLGAEGPNIKIGFDTDSMYLDRDNDATVFGVGTETTSYNDSYTSYASPYLAGGRRSWQRDEVYRLYIVFFDARGRSSSAKWVCDLRMPSLHDATYGSLTTLSGDDIIGNTLFPTVLLKSFPTGAVAAQLLRVERGGSDRSILTQGLILKMAAASSPLEPVEMGGTPGSLPLIKMVSPEINITNNVSLGSSDYLENVGWCYYDTTLSYSVKYFKSLALAGSAYTADDKATVTDAVLVQPRASTDTFTFAGNSFINYNTTKNAYGSTGLFLSVSNLTWTPLMSSGAYFQIANYKRDVHASQYQGYTYEARSNNVAIPASDLLTAVDTTYNALKGDTFINYFDVCTQLFDLTKKTGGAVGDISANETCYVALESSINCDLRHDRSMSKATFYDSGSHPALMQEVAGKWVNDSGDTYDQSTSLYQYNTVYSQDSNAQYYINVSDDVSTETTFDCMIRTSKVKLSGESLDSWTLFPVNNFIEVSADKGKVTTLQTLNDKLMFWQENAFGVLAVNERSLIKDSGGVELSLGTGGVLDRYDYVSETVGVANNQHLIVGHNGAYWVDVRDRSLYGFSDSLYNLSKNNLMQSWFDEQLSPLNIGYVNMHLAYDTRCNQLLLSLDNSDTDLSTTLVYDEVMKAFSGFYDYYAEQYIHHRDGFLSVTHLNGTDFPFFHNSRLKEKCCFYSYIPAVAGDEPIASTYYQDSTIKVLFNDDYAYTKAFDDLSIVSTVTEDDVEVYNDTFSSIRCYNNYQNTDYCTLTYGTNLERDEREWTTYVPRNAVNKLYSTNPDVFLAANIDKTRTFKERLRDKYMITDYTYTNINNRRFVVPYVTVKYRLSYR